MDLSSYVCFSTSPLGAPNAYKAYVVMKPFEVKSSVIAPAFGKLGFGIQFRTIVNAEILIKHGIIKPKPAE